MTLTNDSTQKTTPSQMGDTAHRIQFSHRWEIQHAEDNSFTAERCSTQNITNFLTTKRSFLLDSSTFYQTEISNDLTESQVSLLKFIFST